MSIFPAHFDSPVSFAHPTHSDYLKNQELQEVLMDFDLYVSSGGDNIRALAYIDQIVKKWVKSVASSKGFQEEFVKSANAKIFAFGSFGLSVYCSESNLDVLCVAPRYVNRKQDFFGDLYGILERTNAVRELQAIETAYVPVMKFKLREVSVDLIFANVDLINIPQNLDISDESILANVDEQSVRSLNGPRVSQQILKLVPDKQNFRKTLKCLRVWANRRGLYSNVIGLLGGINLAIMVAKVCQLYPKANLRMLVSRFFKLYSSWNWPCPIMLCPISEGHLRLGLTQWNPLKNPMDAAHHMPIITPVYPCMNSAYNVTPSTLTFIMEQLRLGNKICEAIPGNSLGWGDLFAPYDFFTNHNEYLQVDLMADNNEDLKVWKSWTRSRLRVFMLKIENGTGGMLQCHPHPAEYSDPKRHCHCAYYIGIARKGVQKCSIVDIVRQFKNIVNGYGFKKQGMHMFIQHLERKGLPEYVGVFQDTRLSGPGSARICMDNRPLEQLWRGLSQ